MESAGLNLREVPRMSFTRVSRASLERRTVSAYSCCSVVSAVLSKRPVMPIIAFIGVRISWLIVPEVRFKLSGLQGFIPLAQVRCSCVPTRGRLV